jgi:hypothetical protein
VPPPQQQTDLLGPPDQRRLAVAQRLEATVDAAFAENNPRSYRNPESLHARGAEVAILEQAAAQALGGVRDHDLSGLRHRLQPRRQIGRITHHRGFA